VEIYVENVQMWKIHQFYCGYIHRNCADVENPSVLLAADVENPLVLLCRCGKSTSLVFLCRCGKSTSFIVQMWKIHQFKCGDL
jgi:hypothetical protein